MIVFWILLSPTLSTLVSLLLVILCGVFATLLFISATYRSYSLNTHVLFTPPPPQTFLLTFFCLFVCFQPLFFFFLSLSLYHRCANKSLMQSIVPTNDLEMSSISEYSKRTTSSTCLWFASCCLFFLFYFTNSPPPSFIGGGTRSPRT